MVVVRMRRKTEILKRIDTAIVVSNGQELY